MSDLAEPGRSASADLRLTDCDFLVHADPRAVIPLLGRAATVRARQLAAIYRSSLYRHRQATPGVRRELLAVDAARWGSTDLAERFAAVPVAGRPHPGWTIRSATDSGVDGRLLFRFDGGEHCRAVAVTDVAGRPVVVDGGAGFRGWDLTDGELVDEVPGGALAGLAPHVVTMTESGGRLLALTESLGDDAGADDLDADDPDSDDPDIGDFDDDDPDAAVRSLQVWDLTSGTPICEPFRGPDDYIAAAACTVADGHPIVVTFTRSESVQVWDLRGGEPVGEALFDHEDNNVAVACATVRGRPVVVTAMVDTVQVWRCDAGDWTRDLAIAHPGWLSAVAITELAGRAVIVTGSAADPAGGGHDVDHVVQVWDLASGEPVGRPMAGHDDYIDMLACAVADGRTVAVTGGMDFTVRAWDLTDGCRIGEPMTGHGPVRAGSVRNLGGCLIAATGDSHGGVRAWDLTADGSANRPARSRHTKPINAVACVAVEGRAVAVTTSMDTTVRRWDLAGGGALGRPLTAHDSMVEAVATSEVDGRPVAVTGGWDHVLVVWDLTSGEPIGRPLASEAHSTVDAVACTMLHGRPIAVAGGLDGTLRMWDLASGEPVGRPLTGLSERVLAVACIDLDGRPVAVACGESDEVWLWDLASGEPVGKPLTGHLRWSGEAAGQPGTGTKLYVQAVACARPDGRPIAVTGGDDGTVRRWDLATGRQIGEPLTGHEQAVESVACADLDGRAVVAAGGRDRTVRVWDLASGEQLGPELTFPDGISAVAWAPGGDLVIAFGSDIAVLKRGLATTATA